MIKGKSYLLRNKPSISIDPELATLVGLHEAIILQQIHYWLQINEETQKNHKDGRYWTYNTYEKWHDQFPFFSVSTIKRTINKLEKQGLLFSGNYNKMGFDQTKWYTINYDKLNSLLPLVQIDTMEEITLSRPIPETSSETTNLKEKDNDFSLKNSPLDSREVEIPQRKYNNKTIKAFIDYYMNDFYFSIYNKKHPALAKDQYKRVFETLESFAAENLGLNLNEKVIDEMTLNFLQEMAEDFYVSVKNTDHNINHFASYKILEIREFRAM